MKKRRNWLWILLGVAIVLLFVGIGAIIAATAWVQQNLEVTQTTPGTASDQFERVRSRFAGRPPLLELRDGRPAYTGGKLPDPPATPAPVSRLHVLVWDPSDNRLVTVAVPYWLLRLKSGPIKFSSYASGWDDEGVQLRPEDIEKYGPGILIDSSAPHGERFLLWSE
jgi:hypothetical protein